MVQIKLKDVVGVESPCTRGFWCRKSMIRDGTCYMLHGACCISNIWHVGLHMVHAIAYIACCISHVLPLPSYILHPTSHIAYCICNISYLRLYIFHPISCIGWRSPIGCLKLQVIFRKSATNHRFFWRQMSYSNEASQDSTPPCIVYCISDI